MNRPAPTAAAAPTVARMVEDIVGCKWSLAVLARIRAGVSRPGAIRRSLPGLSTKVMNERLAKMTRYGLLARTAYEGRPPRVEYALTPLGGRLAAILDDIDALQAALERERAGYLRPEPAKAAATPRPR